MTFQSFERPLKHSVVFTLLVFCLAVLTLQPAFAYRIAENTGTVGTNASYSTGLTASNTKNIVSRTGVPLTATLAISSTNYSSGGFFGCGGFLQAECARKLQLSNDDVLGARDGGGSNGATSSLFTPNVPVNSTRTANVSNAGAWRVLHNLRNCNGSASNQCDGLGTVTLTFSRPVLNPVLHLSELGGLEGVEGAPTGTVHARLTISAVNGGTASAASLTAVSGTNLTVSGTNRIQANSVLAGTNISCTTGSPTQNTGCGSVRVNGTITSIQFAASLYINRISSDLSSTVGDGYSLAVTVDEDFGDAPASYDTDATNGAASHVMGNLRLGSSVDSDNINTLNYSSPVIQPSPNAGANSTDDNGVTYPLLTSVTSGSTYTASVVVSARTASARICGWIDFNTNGVFDTNERSTCTDVTSSTSSTSNNLVWTLPAGATITAGTRQTRVRVSYDTTGVQSPTGRVDSGEVEDGVVTVTAGAGNPALACQSNLYSLQGDLTNGFRNIRTVQPTGTLGSILTTVPANGGAVNPNEYNAGMAISPDGSKVFVNTPSGLLRIYDVLSGSWSTGPTLASGLSLIRSAITSNGIGYASREDQLYSFQTSSPYSVSGPVTITSINGGPAPTNSNGDLFADRSGNLFLLANPLTDGTLLNLYRIAANGNSLYLGTLNATSGQYGGFAAIPSGVYASSSAGNILRTDLSAFTSTQTAGTSSARGSSDLASCFYPALDPVIQALKTSTKVAGSASAAIGPGDTIEYRIVIRNVGTLPAADVKFQDSIPAGTTYVAGSTTYNYSTASGKPQVALADVSGVMPFVTARTIESPSPNLSAGVLLVDSTGAGTMATTSTDRDREVVITFRVTVNADATSVSNQGVVTYIDDPGPPSTATVQTDDPTTPEPNDSTTTTVNREVDLSITKTGTQTANSGSLVSYVIRLTNNSLLPVNGAVINDTLPAGLSNAYWNCVVPIDGTFATTATIGTRTDEVCIDPATSATTTKQTGSLIQQTVNLPAGKTVEIRVIGRANGAALSNVASVTLPVGFVDLDLTNNTTAAVSTSVLSALDVTSCSAVKMLDANGVSNSAVAWPVQQGITTANVSFNRTGNYSINQTHTANASTGTAPHPLLIGQGTDRFTKGSGTTWSWTATFSQPIPLNQVYLHLNDINAYDPTITLSVAGGTATLADLSGYSSNQSGTAQELLFNQSNGQITRAFNRNLGNEADDANPRGSIVLLSSSSKTVTSITFASSNMTSGDAVAIEFGARVGCDYGDAAASAGDPHAGVLASYLQMGATIPDVEAVPATPRDFTGDDVTNRDDEDIITTTPQLNTTATSFSLSSLSVFNNTGAAATLRGWIDVNSNNVVDAGEQATVAVPTNAAAQTVSLNWPTLPALTAGTKLLRFTLLDDLDSLFGEIEDHAITIVAPNPPLQCASNMYALVGDTTTNGFRSIQSLQPDGTLGALIATIPANGGAINPNELNAGLAINPDGTKIFITTRTNRMHVFDVATSTWIADVAIPSGDSYNVRMAITSAGVGYISSDNQLWQFQTTAPYTVSAPVTINPVDPSNPGPSTSLSNGDLFSDSQGNLYLLANPLSDGTRLNLFKLAPNGTSLFLGELSGVVSDSYGGFAALPSGIYASSGSGRIIRANLAEFTTLQTAAVNSTRGNSDLASCYYPTIAPVIEALKTSTKVAGSAGTSVRVGDTLEYRIVIRNTGNFPAAGVTFVDPIPAGTTYVPNSTTYNYALTGTKAQQPLADVAGAMPFVTARLIQTPNQGGGVLLVDSTGIGAMATNVADRDREVVITFQVTVNAGAQSVQNQGTVTRFDEIDPPTTVDTPTETASDPIDNTTLIKGRVFNDNSGTTAIAANAYNGIQDAGEIGLTGNTVELNNCTGTVIATTQTDGSGDYAFTLDVADLSSPNFCITQTNLIGYESVSGTTGYIRATDTITLAKTNAAEYPNHNFGDARLALILITDGQQTTTAGGTVSYPHILRSEAVLDVGTLNTVSTENPTLGWTTTLYRDTNCNGVIDAGEPLLTNAIGTLLPTQEICVVQRVNAPATASAGAQHVATLSASYTATVQGGAVLTGDSNVRTDTTLVGSAGLDMRKQVRVVDSCPSTGADMAAFTDRNTAQNGDFLEYEIIYNNRSTRNLNQVTVRDFVPSNALFKNATCQTTPSGSSCSVDSQPAMNANGAVSWLVTGPVAPAAQGSVRFCVQVPALSEPPIQ